MKFRKYRVVLFILLALIGAYVFWWAFQVCAFRQYRGHVVAREREIEVVYHAHSLLSDGTKDVPTVAREAERAGANCLILTDHGSPNRKSMAWEGFVSDIFLIAGSELSVSRGHLVGLDFVPPEQDFPQNAEEAIRHIAYQGGFSIVAHPFYKVPWLWGTEVEFSGIELLNGNAEFKRKIFPSLFLLPVFLVQPKLALLRMLDNPQESLVKWDELNRQHTIYGYFATDAHVFYRQIFSLFRLHVLLGGPISSDYSTARSQILGSLRKGNFYNAIEAAATARGFRFSAEKDGVFYPMGHVIERDGPVALKVACSFPFKKEVRLLRDGQTVLQTDDNAAVFLAREPGVYRVEVYLRERTPLHRNIPWIVSNPIFLRKERP